MRLEDVILRIDQIIENVDKVIQTQEGSMGYIYVDNELFKPFGRSLFRFLPLRLARSIRTMMSSIQTSRRRR